MSAPADSADRSVVSKSDATRTDGEAAGIPSDAAPALPAPAPPLRRAVAADGPVLARLTDAAGEGLPAAFWAAMAAPGQDAWHFGAERQAARAERGGIIVMDEGDGALAGLIGHLVEHPEEIDAETPAAFVPLVELENQAVGSWYINILAALPEARGSGRGTALVRAAEEIGRAQGARSLSLIASDANHGAIRLYERLGFVVADRRPQVAGFGWTPRGEDWLLMIRPGL